MACYNPMTGYKSRVVNESGKRSIVFSAKDGYVDLPVKVPCGQCIGCRLERSRQWAIRCYHESQLYDENCFITLTYNNENLPKDGTLVLEDLQKFMKRLRRKYGNKKIRYFACGEYGEKLSRPHYHLCLFGFDFPDKEILCKTNTGDKLYRSNSLEEIWPYGFSTIGEVTYDSAAYVARYIVKKISGKRGMEHYNNIDRSTGEIVQEKKPEFTVMSRRPGIGRDWIDSYVNDVYNYDHIILNGKELKPPKYYDNLFQENHPKEFFDVKINRKKDSLTEEAQFNNTYERLRVREKIKLKKLKELRRIYENEDVCNL